MGGGDWGENGVRKIVAGTELVLRWLRKISEEAFSTPLEECRQDEVGRRETPAFSPLLIQISVLL